VIHERLDDKLIVLREGRVVSLHVQALKNVVLLQPSVTSSRDGEAQNERSIRQAQSLSYEQHGLLFTADICQ